MASDALGQAWRFILNDVYLRKAEDEGEMTPEERDVLEEFLGLPLTRENVTEFLDSHFPHDMAGFDHFMYNLRHYDANGNLAYKPKKKQQQRRIAEPVDFSDFLNIPSFEEWEAQQKKSRRRFPTRDDAKKAYERFRMKTVQEKSGAVKGFVRRDNVHRGGLGDYVEPIGDEKSIWELLTGDSESTLPALKAITQHQTKLGRMLYDRMESHPHSEVFAAACAALTTEQLIGSMTANTRESNRRLVQLNQLDSTSSVPHHYWDDITHISSLDTDDGIKNHIVRAYTRLFSDMMHQIRDAVFDARRDKKSTDVRDVLLGPKGNKQRLDDILRVPGITDEIHNRIDAYLMTDTHADERQREGERHRDLEIERNKLAVEKNIRERLRAMKMGAEQAYEGAEPLTDEEKIRLFKKGEGRAYGKVVRRIINEVATKHIAEACLNDVSLRAGMGYTDDFDGNPIARSPMADWLERQHTLATVGGDEKGGRDVIRTTQLGDVSEIISRLYDFTNAVQQGVAGDFSTDTEQKLQNRELNWQGILLAWDRLNNRQKGILMNMVKDPQGGRAAMSPLIGSLLVGRGRRAPLPLDVSGEPRINGKTYIEAFVDHILESQTEAERKLKRDPEDRDALNRLFTQSNRRELIDYLSHDKVTTPEREGGESGSKMPVWKDYDGKACEPVYVAGVTTRKMKRDYQNVPIGPETPEDTIDAVLAAHSLSKYGENGMVTPVEMIYAHVYDRMQRRSNEPFIDEIESARHTKDYESIGENYSLADWLDEDNWDSVTGTARAMGYYNLQGLPDVPRGLTARWKKARAALRPTDHTGRERTDADIMNSVGFKDKYGRYVADFDPTRESPESHRCSDCGGDGRRRLPSGRVLNTPCKKCMSSLRQVKETFRGYSNLPESLLERWVGCQNPIVKSKNINITTDTLKLIDQYRKDHARDTETLYKAIRRTAFDMDVGLIICRTCGGNNSNCKTCGGIGKVVDPMLFARDVLGSFGDENQYTQADMAKQLEIESAFRRMLQGIRSSTQDEIEDKMGKGIWPSQRGIPGQEYDRHLFSFLPVMHGDGGPLTMDNLERLFLEVQDYGGANYSQDEEEFKRRLERRLSEQADSVLQPSGPHEHHLSAYETRHFIESEHTQALLDALSESAGRSFPADRVRSLLKKVWHQDIDGNNVHLDDGRFSDGPCTQCNGQHCSQCNYTGREGIRMMISRSPALAKYPPRVLQQVVAHRDLDRPLSVLESPIAQMPLGHHVCGTCNHGMGSEVMRGNKHSSHILNPEAVPVNRLAAAADNGVNVGAVSVLLSEIRALERFKEQLDTGRVAEFDESIQSSRLNAVRKMLSGEEERRILEEVNRNAPLAPKIDFGEIAEAARDDARFDVPSTISHYIDGVEQENQKCPHCCQLHAEGIISENEIRLVGEEEAYSREQEGSGGELGSALSMGSTLCKNMVEAIQENKAGYGNMDLDDAAESMDDALIMMQRREKMTEESMRLLHGIDALQPITEHLTKENLGVNNSGYGRDVDIGGDRLVRLPDVRMPLAKTMLWTRMNDPTKRSRLSQITGSNAIQRKESDMRHEHSLFTFLNVLENGQHLPQSKMQDQMLERLYALYILNPNFGGRAQNILGYRDPAQIDNEKSDAQKRVDWAKSIIGPIGRGAGKITKKAMKIELKDYFSHLAPLLRLEQIYKDFRHTPVGSIRRGPATEEGKAPSVLPESLLDAKWRNENLDAPFLDMRPDSDLDQTMGLLRIHSVNLSDLANYGRLSEDQMGFLSPLEHHPSLEYLLNPNIRKVLDPTIIRAWINHEDDRLPEVMKTEGKSWDEILDERFEDKALSEFSFPGLLWNYATGGMHEHEGEGGWPEVDDLVDDEGNLLVDTHLVHFYHYLAKEMKLRSDNKEGSRRMMQKSLKAFPRINANEFGTGSRCLVCRGSNHGTLPLGLAMHLHPRLQEEMPDDKRITAPAVKSDDGTMELLYPDEHGAYDFSDKNVRKYVLENLAPFGHEPGENNWRKVYDDHMKHEDVPFDSEGEPIPFEKWLPLQSAECVACKGQCHCSACDGHGHGEMSEAAKEASLALFLSTAQALHNMVGLIDVNGHLEYHPEFAEVQAPPEDPMYEVFGHIIDRQNELDMALRSLRGPDGDIIGLTGGLQQFRELNISDQIELVERFQDELAHLVYGDPSLDLATKKDKKKEAKRRKALSRGEAPDDDEDDEEESDDQTDDLDERIRENREIKGFFSDADTWKESQKRRILGGFLDHVSLIQGPDYGEDLYLLDEDGNYLKDKDENFATLERYGYDASHLRMLGHEGPLTDADIEEVASRGPLYGPKGKKVPKPASAVADINKDSAVPLLHTDGKPVIARVRNEGKGYKKGIDNKMPQNLTDELEKFREDKFEELKKEKLEELGIDENKLTKKDKEAISTAVTRLVKKETEEDGSKKFWDKRKHSHFVPLLVSPNGEIHTMMDKQQWFKERETMTEDEIEADKKHRAHLQRMRDKGFNDSIEGLDPKKSRFNVAGWDRDGLANPIGTTKTNLHKTSSFVRGRAGLAGRTDGVLGLGNKTGWHNLLLRQFNRWGYDDIDSLKAAADRHIKELSHEQYYTPYGGGANSVHRHFVKIPKGERDKKSGLHFAKEYGNHLGKKNFGGVEIHNAHTSQTHNVVMGRDNLTRRLQAMARGGQPGNKATGVRLCPTCLGSQIRGEKLCPACDGHGYIPMENAEPIVRYDKMSALPFHTKAGGVPIETDMDTFKKALRRRLSRVSKFEERPVNEERMAMIEKKLDTIMSPDFRIIVPHKGWGARVGHRVPRVKRIKDKDTGEVKMVFDSRPTLDSGWGDGFLGLHSTTAVQDFIRRINKIMSTPSEWDSLYKEYQRLAKKHISGWKEGEEGSVKTINGEPQHVLVAGWDSPEDWADETTDSLDKAIKAGKTAGDNKKKKGSKKRREHDELKRLRTLVNNISAIKIGMFNSHQGEMAIRQDRDTPFGRKSFTESKQDSVHFLEREHAQRILDLMKDGAPFINSLLPLGHGGDIDIARGAEGSSGKMSSYRKRVIGNRSVGLAPNDRIEELRRLVREGQKGIMGHRMGYTPLQVSKILNQHGDPETARITHQDIVDICTKLGINASYVLPYEHEVAGKEPDELRQIYRSRYEDIRRMADEAYDNTHWAETPSAPESIYDYSQQDTSRIQIPNDTNVQTSFDSPLDSAFFILKNII